MQKPGQGDERLLEHLLLPKLVLPLKKIKMLMSLPAKTASYAVNAPTLRFCCLKKICAK